MFCYLRHQSLVSMTTAGRSKLPWGGAQEDHKEQGCSLEKGQPVSMVRAGEPNLGQPKDN